MKTVALIPNRERRGAVALATEILTEVEKLGGMVRIPQAESEAMGREDLAHEETDFSVGIDAAISVGGDGTMLWAASLVGDVPLLGVNLGALGFLTELEPEEASAGVARLLSGDFAVDVRQTVCIEGEPGTFRNRAVNEVSIERANPERLVELEVSLSSGQFTSYRGDGVLVATPTGSTAYSFSLGGPVISPDIRCIVVAPVAPHSLFARALVVSDDEVVRVRVVGDRGAAVNLDGRRMRVLAAGEEISVRRSETPVQFVRLRERPFYDVLKAKFGLSTA